MWILKKCSLSFSFNRNNSAGLNDEILEHCKKGGLDIMMCRSQRYHNAAVMSSVYERVQAIIETKNKKSIFVGCIDQSINLCGQYLLT